ncbi:MAG TPA: uroporphyrinogen decarboxylase [Candidatus Nanopelagicaceae bacterium]
MSLPLDHPLITGRTAHSQLIQAYRGIRTERLPIWFMRQAGRSLPEYRALREGVPMLDSCLRPEMAAEITLQPVRRHKVDAAIFFSDIVIPLRLAGVDVDIVAGVGPVMAHPVRTREDLNTLKELEPSALAPISEAIKIVIAELGDTPLIGFGGAPFTLASYLIEGAPSKDLPITRALMKEDPALWNDILAWVARTTSSFIRAQVTAGASGLQLFDSWAGRLTLDEYVNFAAPHSKAVMTSLSDLPVPRVHFGTKTGSMLPQMRDVGATVMGIDSDTPLDVANSILGGTMPLQGNIDPEKLSGPWEELQIHTLDVIRRGSFAPAHIVNLGHGVPPTTDPDLLTRLVAFVHEQ